MKTTGKPIILVFALLVLAASANAQSPREELQQMVEQLQKTPNDNALREKIIKLAITIKPALAIPEEAERRMARGAAAFKGATLAEDYQDAAKEFEQATLAAPWYGDAYNNLGVAQDKAGKYEAALRSLKLAQLASPDSKDIKALIYEVEYRRDKALAAPRVPELLTKLQGTWVESQDSGRFITYWKAQVVGDTIKFFADRYVTASGPTSLSGDWGEFRLKSENGEFKGIYVEGTQKSACTGRETPARATLSADGLEMTITTTLLYTDMYTDSNGWGHRDKVNCRYSPQSSEWRMVLRKQ